MRSARLRQADRLRVPQGQARLWAISNRSAHQPEPPNLPTALPLESNGVESHTRQSPRHPDRKLYFVYLTPLSPCRDRPIAGIEAGYCGVWRPGSYGRDAPRCPGSVVPRNRPARPGPRVTGEHATRRADCRSGPRGVESLSASHGTAEIWQLEWLWG